MKTHTAMNVTALLASYQDLAGERNYDVSMFVAQAICYVIQRYFLTAAPSFVMTLSCRNRRSCNFYNDMLDILFPIWGTPVLQVVAVKSNTSARIPGRRYLNLLLVDSFAAFADIDIISYTDEYNMNEYYYIFLKTLDHLVPDEMQRILDYCWQHQLIHCNVQVQNALGEVLVYTYFPFTEEHCDRVVPVLVNRFVGAALESCDLFPSKLRNFHRCALVGAIWHVPPYIFLSTRPQGEPYIAAGIEGMLVLELSKKLNFTLTISTPRNNEQRGRFVNNMFNGALGMLIRREADFTIGCFRRTVQRDVVASSLPNVYQSSQTVALYLPAYNLSSLEVLTYPFKTETWMLLLFIVVLLLSAVYVVNMFRPSIEQDSHCYMNVLLMTLGMTATATPTRHYSRLFCVIWLLFTLIIRTEYQALIFHVIRRHVSSPLPTTLDDLVANNFTVVMNKATYETLDDIALLGQMNQIILNSSLDDVAFEYIEREPSKRLVAVGPLEFLLSYVHNKKKKFAPFKTLRQPILLLQTTMYMRKHSYLIDHFDEQILWMRTMGFIEIWTMWEFERDYLDTQTRKHLDRDELLQLQQLHMIFVFVAIGMAIGLIVFIFEILSVRAGPLRTLFNAI